MKKVLLATTALVFSAGYAAAEVTIDGSANMGFKYAEYELSYAGKKAAGWYEIDMNVTGTMESDAGLTFGATIELDSDYTNDNSNYGATVFTSGSFGTITVGHVDPVADDIGLTDIGFDGIGTDNVGETGDYGMGKSLLKGYFIVTTDAALAAELATLFNVPLADAEAIVDAYGATSDLRWDYSVGAVTLGASVDTIQEDYSLKAGYNFGVGSATIAYSKDEATGWDSTEFLLKASQNGLGGELYYASSDVADSYGVYGSYKTGALLLEASYTKAEADDDFGGGSIDAWGIGAKYDLGGGAKVAGGIGDIDGNTVADLGVTFSF